MCIYDRKNIIVIRSRRAQKIREDIIDKFVVIQCAGKLLFEYT